MRWFTSVGAIFAIIGLGACQTAGTGGTTYSFLYTPADHVQDMIEINNLEEADRIYQSQKAFFIDDEDDEEEPSDSLDGSDESGDADTDDETVTLLLQAIDREHGKAVRTALGMVKSLVDWPAPANDWPKIQATLEQCDFALHEYSDYTVFEDRARFPPDYVELENLTDGLRSEIVASTLPLFQKYDITSQAVFFDVYPVTKDLAGFLSANRDLLEEKLDTLSTEDLSTFANSYDKWIDESLKTDLASIYFRKFIGDTDKPDFPTIMRAVASAKENGFSISEIEGVNVAAIEVTSRTLLEHGQIEFPIAIEKDLPFNLEKADLDNAFLSPLANNADVVILIDVASARNNRKITKTEEAPSEYQAGTKTVPNPAHNIAQNEVNNAQLEMQRAAINSASVSAQYCYGMGCLGKAIAQIAAAAVEAGAQEELETAMSKLQSTPMQLTEPVYENYSFRKIQMDATKEATVNFYVIDRNRKRYLKSSFDAIESKSFTVAYNIHNDDRYRSRHLSQMDAEQDVVDFEREKVTVSLSDLLSEYIRQEKKSRPLPELTAIRSEVLEDKNKALVAFEKNRFEVVPDRNDPRFDSVVVVYHPGGGLGTGFFVRDDLILTNYHVIEGSQFVEMKLFNGQETFGKVISSDVRLDLALIKSQARGKPVSFYSANALPQGKTVEVIGHPSGLEFSITRGIVSSLREIHSRYMPGGRKVRFIQTDAAINPGNSGGPMFLANQVVGVNTQKLAATELEGLSFAVHYADVMTFLTENTVAVGG